MEYITPEENVLFTKALRFLYERLAQLNGFEADAHPHLEETPAT